MVAKSLSTLEICPERAFWGLPQCGKASRCENALVLNFFHDRFGLDGRNSRGASSPVVWGRGGRPKRPHHLD